MFSAPPKWEKTGDYLVFQCIICTALLKSLDNTSQSHHDHQSFAGQFHKIINIFVPLHFRQASVITNPGQGSFAFSDCQELIAALDDLEFLGYLMIMFPFKSTIIGIMLLWSLAFGKNFVISLISPTFVQIHKLLLPMFLKREVGQ